jgi:hypothetical protein
MRKAFYRRQLPHLQRHDKPHFLTFCTDKRWILPEHARSIVLDSCLHDKGTKIEVQVGCGYARQVHMIFTPLVNQQAMEVYSLAEITDAIKAASAHKINRAMRRRGRVWQPESFDHVLRSSESLQQKVEYLLQNPVRQSLAPRWENYPWIWQKPS